LYHHSLIWDITFQINICAIPLFRWHILSYDHIYELWITYMFSWFFAWLSGARVVHIVHVVNLYDVISCNVRYHFCVKTTFFCRGFMFFIDVICIVLRILVSNTISIISVLLSPYLYWCWFVSLQIWNSCLQRSLSTFIYKQQQLPVALVYANKL
jgi:hypothetical protein